MLRFLTLGDSYTIGEGVGETERWPNQLAGALRQRGYPVADIGIIAQTGWTTGELLAGIDQAKPQGYFDLVSLLIGVNNQYRGRDLEEYRVELRELLQRAVVFAGGKAKRILVLSIPDWGVTPYSKGYNNLKISADIDSFNQVNREQAETVGAQYIDITTITRNISHNLGMIAPDGLHPSGKMYTIWVDLLLPSALEAIKNSGDYSIDYSLAEYFDKQDELAHLRDEFVILDPDLIYMDGNSLGRLPQRTVNHLHEAVDRTWGERLIRLWNDGWINTPYDLGRKIALLIGAQPDEVVVADSTSINLFKLVVAALQARPGRDKIISDVFNFPSDLYILQGVIELLGNKHQLELVPSQDGISIAPEAVEAVLDDQTALLTLSHVVFKSAYMYDLKRLTNSAHLSGALTLWDLSHSTGAVPLYLNDWGADLAIGCTYKYLNGGPGSPAFLYVRRELQERLSSPIWGWFANRRPFEFELDFIPTDGIGRFCAGTPPMLSLKAIEPAVDILLETGIEKLRAKSIHQSEYLIFLADRWLLPLGYTLGSPRQAERRGSHVSLRHPEAYRINRAMIESPPPAVRVIPDFRSPDNIRLGIAPIYTSYVDIYLAVARMRDIVQENIYEQYSGMQSGVT